MPRVDNNKFYLSAIKKYGISPKGLNWISKTTQLLRFDAIFNFLPNDINNYTLLDAGCGFGDFYKYLSHKNKLPKNYIGVDSIDVMQKIASKNTSSKIIKADITKDEIPNADYIVCSGAMNILNRFETHLFIQNCFNSSNIAFIFNILKGEKQSDTYNYFSIDDIKNIAKELDVKKIEYKTDYIKNDVTFAFYTKKDSF